MTDEFLFEVRKQREIDDLRVRAGTAISDEALSFLREAERRLKLGGIDNLREADRLIGLARSNIEEKERQA